MYLNFPKTQYDWSKEATTSKNQINLSIHFDRQTGRQIDTDTDSQTDKDTGP